MDYGENAVSVGDLGVVQDPSSPNTYTYTKLDKEEQETLPDDRKQDLYASYNTNNDYGQLLYLKKGTTDRYTTDINYAELKTKNVLKTYMPYSARYKNLPGETNQFDITVVYTLDNYVTIEGKIRNIYYKWRYLMKADIKFGIKISIPKNTYFYHIDYWLYFCLLFNPIMPKMAKINKMLDTI